MKVLWTVLSFGLFCTVLYFLTNASYQPVRVVNVHRVMMHEKTRYTLISQEPGSSELVQREFSGPITLVRDIQAGESLWAEGECEGPALYNCRTFMIHLHAVGEIEGGPWVRGKYSERKGQTVVIE